MIALALLWACAGPEEGGGGGSEIHYTPLSDREQLIRLSVELRGVHPSPEELAAIEADPGLYEQYADAFLEDERFLQRIRDLFEERWRMRTGLIRFNPAEAGVTLPTVEVAEAVAEEPLYLLSAIVEQDLPITTLVTADWTMADETVAQLWDLDYPAGGTGWQQATYRDGRPMAGILSTTALWARYISKGGNANRTRANAIARILLCDDYLARPIVLDRTAIQAFADDAEDAIAASVTCQGCHVTMDPLAANLFGFFNDANPENILEEREYRPENEGLWEAYADRPPGYFGTPTEGLEQMAAELAADPRFAECMARTVWEGMGQRTYSDADWTEFQALFEVFEEADLRVKPLVRAIVTSEAWRAGAVSDPATGQRLPTVRMASPRQLGGIIEELTGYRMEVGGRDILSSTDFALPTLLGGVDAVFATSRTYQPTVSSVILVRELTRAAADTVVDHDLGGASAEAPRLLTLVDRETLPEDDPDLFAAQMATLHERVTGIPVEEGSELPDRLVTLWSDAYVLENDPLSAWKATVSAVLRDPRVVFY